MGQDIVKLDSGGAPPEGDKAPAAQEPKAPASDEKPTSSDPQPKKESEAPPPPPKPEKAPEQPSKPSPPPKEPTAKPQEAKPAPTKAPGSSPFGNREERRVSTPRSIQMHMLIPGKVKMNRMRLRIAERLKQSQNTAASLTTFNEVDMSSVMEFRKLYKDEILKKTGVKLGFMSAFSKACVLAMKEVPAVNASIEGPGGGDTIVYRDYVDISVAVATEKGLVTPVVRNAEALDLVGIEGAIAELGKKVNNPDPMQMHLHQLTSQ